MPDRRKPLNWGIEKWGTLRRLIEAILNKYHPLTVRGVVYKLEKHGYTKSRQLGDDVIRVLKWLRLEGVIPWEWIDEDTRRGVDYTGFSDPQEFMADQVKQFLEGYRRKLWRGQKREPILWVEKNTMHAPFEEVANEYNVYFMGGRGQSDKTSLHEVVEMAEEKKKPHIILGFADFDGHGEDKIFTDIKVSIEKEFKSKWITCKFIALTEETIKRFTIPIDKEAVKKKREQRANDGKEKEDYHLERHVEEHGEIIAELDAVEREDLKNIIRESIEDLIDNPKAWERKVKREQRKLRMLAKKKKKIEPVLRNILGI